MKIIGIILSLLFLSLSFMPCADAANSFDDDQHIQENHSDHSAGADLCSPFCQCQCCHNHIIVQRLPILKLKSKDFSLSYFEYKESSTSKFTKQFLPPPRV